MKGRGASVFINITQQSMLFRSILLAAMLPLSAFAQQKATRPALATSTEFAFNIGHALDNVHQSFSTGGYLRGSLSLLKSKGHFQYGFTIEGGTNSWDGWYLAPGVVANYRRSSRPSYWYGGAMAGYNCVGEMIRMTDHKLAHGYVFGLQAGYVQQLGKRLSLNGEAGIRSSQSYHRYTEDIYTIQHGQLVPQEMKTLTESRTAVYLPVTVGLRYRLGA